MCFVELMVGNGGSGISERSVVERCSLPAGASGVTIDILGALVTY